MKNLLILPLLVLLTACVTYYDPETALEDGVYYAGNDLSYVLNADPYAGVSYYPWSSLDHFYLGYNPYPRHGFGYAYGGYGSGSSFGINYGYSPWYYPYSYYGYYSPWYASYYHYPHYPARRPWRGYSEPPVSRHVSTAPYGYSGNRGMVIRGRDTTKIGKSRLQPVRSSPASRGIAVTASNPKTPSHGSSRSRSRASSPTTSRHRTSQKGEPSRRVQHK